MATFEPRGPDEVETPAQLMAFHATQKMELLSHDPRMARVLGRIASGSSAAFARHRAAYVAGWGVARSRAPTVGGHVNALQHLAGHIVDRAAARRMADEIAAYRNGRIDLATVKRALRDHLEAAQAEWASRQSYLFA